MEALINSNYAEVDERTETLRKCVRSEETCPQGASEAYFRTLEKPLEQCFAGDGVFYQRFPINSDPLRTAELNLQEMKS